MLNIIIQILTLFSGLLINFMIPLLYGLEQYGFFIKANVLVFLFHKLLDLMSEPLISAVEKHLLFVISGLLSLIVFIIFFSIDCFLSLGSTKLLATMLWSNCVLLTMYAYIMREWIVGYLVLFVSLFLSLLFLNYTSLFQIDIVTILEITNFVPSSMCFLMLLINKKIIFSFNTMFTHVIKMMQLAPRLICVTLVNNLFTNILPFYLSNVFSMQMLGLYKVQVSMAQAVAAIFPMSSKMMSTSFLKKDSARLMERVLTFSVNYFHMIAIIGCLFFLIIDKRIELMQTMMLLPLIHVVIVLERYLLGMKKSRQLMLINLCVALIACFMVVHIFTIYDMTLLYAVMLSCYILFMLSFVERFLFKSRLAFLAVASPTSVLACLYSSITGLSALLLSAITILYLSPHKKESLYFLKEIA